MYYLGENKLTIQSQAMTVFLKLGDKSPVHSLVMIWVEIIMVIRFL